MYRITLNRIIKYNNTNFLKLFQRLTYHNQIRRNFINPRSIFGTFKSFSSSISAYNLRSEEDIKDKLENLVNAYKHYERIHIGSIEHVLKHADHDLLKDYGLFLIQCCGALIIDCTLQVRQALCDRIWSQLKAHNLADVQHYNTYLQTCIENKIHINYEKFLQEMSCEPNETTYRLLLKSVCELGDAQQALQIVTAMKERQFVADEQLFNMLVLCHAIKGGLSGVMPILKTMQSAHVTASEDTFKSIISGLILYNDRNDFIKSLQMYSKFIQEKDFLQLLTLLGSKGLHAWFIDVMELTGIKQISKQNMDQFMSLCIHLIHMGNPDAAIVYYKKFVQSSGQMDDGNYAFPLLYEMLMANTETTKIIEIINDLKKDKLNTVALEKLLGIALKKRLIKPAWELFHHFSNWRPHYFWPFLKHASKEQRELGVLNILEQMLKMNVRPDVDTLQYYCINLCDSNNPERLLLCLQDLGLSVREILTPMMAVLIRQNRTQEAALLCEQYDQIAISSDQLVQPLIKSWNLVKDIKSTIIILKKLSTDSRDTTSQFLIKTLKKCNMLQDYECYLNLIKAAKSKHLAISGMTSENISNVLSSSDNCTVTKEIELAVHQLQHTTNEPCSIPHPRDMNLMELENQFIQLESKGMETRGILRRLITEHCRFGNEKRVLELRNIFLSKGYQESPGMKTALMHIYVIKGSLENALNMYFSIKDRDSDFHIDEFKIIDLACLLVKNQQFDKALNILSTEATCRKIRSGPETVRNCWKLIGSCNDEVNMKKIFLLLVEKGYCSPSNILLGPFVKFYLNRGDLEEAVRVYKECIKKYNCTPLQLELLSAAVKLKKLDLLQDVLNASAGVHGAEAMVIPCIAAFAQNGFEEPLRRFLVNAVVSKAEMEKRCQRWVQEKNVSALETVANACYSLKSNVIDKSVVYYSIMKIHGINNDCEAGVAFYRDLIKKGINVPRKLTDELLRLVQRCKYEIPEELR